MNDSYSELRTDGGGSYQPHWCPRCEAKNRVWMDSPDFTGWVECWSCGRVFNVERTDGVERLRDSVLSSHGLMDGPQEENDAESAEPPEGQHE